MGRPIDLIIGAIYDLNDDRNSGWSAYFAADERAEKAEKEVERLKKLLRRKSGRKIKR
jgi:hypothetical protein